MRRFEEWSRTPPRFGEWETDYDHWDALYTAVAATLAKPELGVDEVEMLLFILARDNEAEHVRELLEDHDEHALRLAAVGLRYGDPDARWQLADLLGRRRGEESSRLLRSYLADSEEYVRRRALLAAAKSAPGLAEEFSKQWIRSEHEYTRLACLSVLHKVNSAHLRQALDVLRTDSSGYVRAKVAEIEGSV